LGVLARSIPGQRRATGFTDVRYTLHGFNREECPHSWKGGDVPIRVLIVDDHQIVRDGLKAMLAREMDIEVVGEAENGREAISLARRITPDVVVVDIGMRELNGIDATRQLGEEVPTAHVVALSMHCDRRYIADMLAAGACAYLVKDSAFDELAKAIRSASEGRRYLSPEIADVVLEDYIARMSDDAPLRTTAKGRALSPREREVLQLIAEGKSTKEVASELHLSVKTIETHRRQIMDKLGIFNIAGLIRFAVREGLTGLED
jgi:DNA-binding NarL/FixJ family response regulator